MLSVWGVSETVHQSHECLGHKLPSGQLLMCPTSACSKSHFGWDFMFLRTLLAKQPARQNTVLSRARCSEEVTLLWKVWVDLTDAEGFLRHVWMVYHLNLWVVNKTLRLFSFGLHLCKPSTQAVRFGPCGLSVCSSVWPLPCLNI